MGKGEVKVKTEAKEEEDAEMEDAGAPGKEKVSYEDRLLYVTPIAQPMASKKLTKKIYKLIKKGVNPAGFERGSVCQRDEWWKLSMWLFYPLVGAWLIDWSDSL